MSFAAIAACAARLAGWLESLPIAGRKHQWRLAMLRIEIQQLAGKETALGPLSTLIHYFQKLHVPSLCRDPEMMSTLAWVSAA